MIALIGLILVALWLVVAVVISKPISTWLGKTKYGGIASLLVFPMVLVAPMVDEIIGRWQFNQLCKTEGRVWLNPEWANTNAVREEQRKIDINKWVITPVYGVNHIYIDTKSGISVVEVSRFQRRYGFAYIHLVDWAGSSYESCTPPEYMDIWKKINLSQLLTNGRNK